jgi:hypothetical protein
MGELPGSGTDLEGLPVGSIIYMGRGSFRMEAVALGGEAEPAMGVVQPVTGAVTAPLHAAPRAAPLGNASEPTARVRSLFSSQIDVPVLAAPLGSAGFRAPVVALSRPLLVTLGGLVLLCGVVVGTAARHLLASPAPLAVVAAPAAAAALAPPIAAAIAPTVVTAPPPPPVVALPVPTMIRVRTKAATKTSATTSTKPAAPARDEATTAAPKAWVDPWAS